MRRRALLEALASLGLLAPAGAVRAAAGGQGRALQLPALNGDLTVYLGRGEGGLYGDIVDAIEDRNPELALHVRRASSSALAQTLIAEARAGIERADVFWSVTSSSLGLIAEKGLAREVPESLRRRIAPAFRYRYWAAISGRIRSIPYNPKLVDAAGIPDDIMAFADSGYRIGWAPTYGAFQSFVTAMILLEGERRTREWLLGVKTHARRYAGELSVVLATARGEVDLGFANHYYTLRLKQGQPDASVELAFTHNDAGCLVNAAGAALLSPGELPPKFVRYLLSEPVQSYLARQAFEIPFVPGVPMPPGLPPLAQIESPDIDLTRLADLRPALRLMRETGVL